MKKQLARLLSAALLLLAFCIAASAADTSGTCGPAACWSFDSGTGTLTISGSGAMEDYEARTGAPWRNLSDSIRTVVIGDRITQIGQNAFSWTAYSMIQFGETVWSIGAEAFRGCENLSGDLTLPDSVQTIGDSAFANCTGLTGTLTLGSGLQTIGAESFAFCPFSGDLVIPDSVTEIGIRAFRVRADLQPETQGTLTLGKNLRTIGVYFLGAAPQLVGTVNANCSFPSDWTLYYLPGTSGWTGEAYEGYRIAPWDGETRWDNLYTRRFGRDNRGDEIGTSWAVNTDTGKITLTDDLNEGCAVAVSYDAEGRVTRIGVLRTREDSAVLSLQDTCRLFLLSASFAPRLNAPVIINDYLPI